MSIRLSAISRAFKLGWYELSWDIRTDDGLHDETELEQLERVYLTSGHELTRRGALGFFANWTIATIEGGCAISVEKCQDDVEAFERAIDSLSPAFHAEIMEVVDTIFVAYLAMLLYHEVGHLQHPTPERDDTTKHVSVHADSEHEALADRFAREHTLRLPQSFANYVGPYLYLDLAGSYLRSAMHTAEVELRTIEEWQAAPDAVLEQVLAAYLDVVCDDTHPSYFRRYLETSKLSGYVYPDAKLLEKVTEGLEHACVGAPLDTADFRRYGVWLLGA